MLSFTSKSIIMLTQIHRIRIKKHHQSKAMAKDESILGDNGKTTDECTHPAKNAPTSTRPSRSTSSPNLGLESTNGSGTHITFRGRAKEELVSYRLASLFK